MLALQAVQPDLKQSMGRNELPSGKTRNELPRKDPSAYDQAMRYLAVITILVLAIVVLVQPVAAQSFKPDRKAGFKAKFSGDYATALIHFRPLAVQVHARGQWRLGLIYSDGDGVTKDLKETIRCRTWQ